MKKASVFYFFLCVFLGLTACSKDNKGIPDWNWGDPKEPGEKVDSNPDIVKLGWTNVGDAFGALPDHIQVYKSSEELESKKSKAYIAVADMSKATFDVLGDIAFSSTANGYGATSVKTLSSFYSAKQSPIIINAGLFFQSNGFYYSQNLVIRNGQLLAPNQNYYSEDWVTMWYPTIGAFCQMEDGTYQATWTYYTSGGVNYYYAEPAANDIKKPPLQAPTATFPAAGKALSPKIGIGGAGVLLHKGEIKNTYVEEMLNVSSTSNQPRTAVGITAKGKMVFFVCEGRQMTSGVAGLTTADVAKVLKSIGCVEALNLDGGGSTCMLINGKETIKPSDSNQRAVLTALSLN